MPAKLHIETTLGALFLGAVLLAHAEIPEVPAPTYREGELIVKYRGPASAPEARDVKARFGLTPARTLLRGRAELVTLPRFTTAAAALAALRADPAVERVEPNFRRTARSVPTPNDPLFPEQWGLLNTGQANFVSGGPAGVAGADLNVLPAWDPNHDGSFPRTGDPSVIVAVIDDAIQISHRDLAADIVAPHNFVACQNPNDPSPVGSTGEHGTMVAGCATGIGNNGAGVAGVAWHASLMPIKFGFDLATELQSIEWARDHGARLINTSFGGPGFSQTEEDAIAALAADDILLVAAAGNDNSNTDVAQLSYPANYDADNIVSVAATNRQDNIASFSQYGPATVDVAAPGLQVITTAIGGGWLSPPGISGTSFASPYVAGVGALLRSHVSPTPSWREIKARLIESGSAVAGANPQTRTSGGRVDAAKALDMAPGPSLVIKSVAFDDGASGNHVMDPGETLDVVFTVRNIWNAATAVSATLAADNGITVNTGTLALGDLAPDAQADARFSITVPSGITDHRYVAFTLTLSDSGSYSVARHYIAELGTLTGGTPVTQAFGADAYDEFHAWHFDVPPLAGPANHTLVVRTSTSNTDIDLLAKQGVPPRYDISVGINPETTFGYFCTDGTTADCRDPATLVSGRFDGNEAITVENPSGTWHFVVVNFAQQAFDYTITATLANGDLRPDPFTFGSLTGVRANTTVTSPPITVRGIDTATFVTVVGGTYSVNGGAFTSAEGSVVNGDVVRVKVDSGSTASARVTLTIGGVTSTFWVNPPPPPGNPSPDTACAAPHLGGGGGGVPLSTLLVLMLARVIPRRAAPRASLNSQ